MKLFEIELFYEFYSHNSVVQIDTQYIPDIYQIQLDRYKNLKQSEKTRESINFLQNLKRKLFPYIFSHSTFIDVKQAKKSF